MLPATGFVDRALVGRDDDLARIRRVLHAAVGGRSGMLVVSGEAGVGKTALVDAAFGAEEATVLVLSGSCLPLQSIMVPLMPLRSALRASSASRRLSRDCLAEMDSGDPARALDDWIDEVTESTPVALRVDDLQWADQSTLDVLMYLAAGPVDRSLALVATVRSEALPDGHPLHRWLADVLRLDRVEQLQLRPLDRVATQAQLAHLLGTEPHQTLVDDVFAHTRGNPFLTKLIARDLPPKARSLPAQLSPTLAAAVRRAWHSLSPAARALCSLAAVGGRPELLEIWQAVAADLRLGDLTASVPEAVSGGVLEIVGEDRYWFHHPVQAQVLEQNLTDAQREHWHAAFARVLERSAPVGMGTVDVALAVADHHDRAGHPREAYDWTLRGWVLAGAAQGSPELLRLMWRAIDLRRQLPDAQESEVDLLSRVSAVAEGAGAYVEELAAVEALLLLLDPAQCPLEVAVLRVRRRHLMMATGAGVIDLEDIAEAAGLSEADPNSWQHAFALAELARTEVWYEKPQAGRHARRALAVARAAGNARALSFALTSAAMVAVTADDAQAALSLATEAVEQAVTARDWWAYVHAVMWELNADFPSRSVAGAEHLRSRRRRLTALGAPHMYVAQLSAGEAEEWLITGDVGACRERLRVTLGSDPGALADIRSRLVAALLDAWQGRLAQSRAHLDRAIELIADSPHHPYLALAAVQTVIELEDARPQDAYQSAWAGLVAPGVPPDMAEWLAPLAARALADQAQAARDTGSSAVEALGQLETLIDRFPAVVADSGAHSALDLLRNEVLGRWYHVEVARARQDPAVGTVWLTVATAATEAQLPWVAVYAWWRAAEDLLGRGHEHRRDGVRAVRTGHPLATELDAATLRLRFEELSRTARVPLASHPTADSPQPRSIPGLTPREYEILDHLLTGATYGQIADALVISEKTVSAHVSNMLRKTGTTSRVELSQRARRLTRAPSQPW